MIDAEIILIAWTFSTNQNECYMYILNISINQWVYEYSTLLKFIQIDQWYGGILLSLAYKINYVNMLHTYVSMKFIYVNMQVHAT